DVPAAAVPVTAPRPARDGSSSAVGSGSQSPAVASSQPVVPATTPANEPKGSAPASSPLDMPLPPVEKANSLVADSSPLQTPATTPEPGPSLPISAPVSDGHHAEPLPKLDPKSPIATAAAVGIPLGANDRTEPSSAKETKAGPAPGSAETKPGPDLT